MAGQMSKQKTEAVKRLLNAFGEIWPDSHWGPLHILIEDNNALDHHLDFCRKEVLSKVSLWSTKPNFDSIKSYQNDDPDDLKEYRAALLLIDMLMLIPEEQRDIHAENEEIE
jgi:hypothetical protein